MPRKTNARQKKSNSKSDDVSDLRIVGGHFRGRRLKYHGREDTRPMKHRVREAIFNLVGPAIKGTHAIDLFAGTGAIGLEAISRGSVSATFIERHIPTGRLVEENIKSLDTDDRCEVVMASAMMWARRNEELPDIPWAVFISPPYDFFVERTQEMIDLLNRLLVRAPDGSMFIVESDEHFDLEQLPEPERWITRTYRPAVVSILRDVGSTNPPDESSSTTS